MVKKMNLRIIASAFILTLAAWLPAVAQQSAGSQPATSTDNKETACACCDHKDHHGHEAKSCCHGKDDQASCSQSKDRKGLACCKEHAKNDASAMNCCKGKEAKMCAKNGKNCCAGKDGQSCCGKDALACNMTDGENCRAGSASYS
jgi:hypothetical protein